MKLDGERVGPSPIDVHVGLRIKLRRKELRISQERLADRIGVTFQQVQKYERAGNRVSASKLWEIARALKAPIAYFFEGLAVSADQGAGKIPRIAAKQVSSPEVLEVAAVWPMVSSRDRNVVLVLVRALAAG
jgi:transcriptional regulator with XRE-family HTH domain